MITVTAWTFLKVQSSFTMDFCWFGLINRFTGFTVVRMVLTFCFSCGLLFYSTLANLTFSKNRMIFEIVSLPCLLLCYHSMQLHSHFVCVVKIASYLPMPFYCLPAHSPETDSLTNTKGCSFSALC